MGYQYHDHVFDNSRIINSFSTDSFPLEVGWNWSRLEEWLELEWDGEWLELEVCKQTKTAVSADWFLSATPWFII